MLKQEVIIIACAFQQKMHNIMPNNNEANNNERKSVGDLGVAVEVTGASYCLVGERERANQFVRTDDFSILVLYIGCCVHRL